MSVRLQKSSKSPFIELLLVRSFQFMTEIKRRAKVRVWITARDRLETVTQHSNITTSYYTVCKKQNAK